MKTITIINQKGGVGKSTTAHNLAIGLARLYKKRVLLIDLDSQGNISYTLGADKGRGTIFELLTEQAKLKDVIQHRKDIDFIASSNSLSVLDSILKDTGKEFKLKEALYPISNDYDYVIIDTPPALGIVTINALTASSDVVIPAQADVYSIQGIGQLKGTMDSVKKYCNNDLSIMGILLTRYNKRTCLTRDITDMIKATAQQLNTRVFNSTIREGIAVKEAQASKKDLFEYAPKSNPTIDYKNLTKEVVTL